VRVASLHGLPALGLPPSLRTRAYDWLRGSPTGLVVLALVTGISAGVGAIVFRELIADFTLLFTGTNDYSGAGHAANPALPWLGPWFIIAVPVVGGLLYGPLIARFAPEARGHGVPEVMLAVAQEGGRIRPRVAVIKSLASAICLGAGGSVGREGPIVQIGSAVGSTVGQVLRLSENNLRLLVACGAAGGISATFNAPIAGVFFALELILRDFEVRSFGVVVLASVVADVISRAAFGSSSFLQLPDFQITSPWEYPLYVVLGIAAAFAGIVFIRGLYGAEDIVDRLWKGRPEWLRPAAGGILLGVLLLALPQLYGVGYTALESAIHGGDALYLLALLAVGKIVATSLTIAIGGSGGVFAPSLYIGGMLGMSFGVILGQIAPSLVSSPGAYALVGMGAVFAAAARAPITSVLIMFELTGDYHIILPLMLAIALAAGLSSLITGDTIYTLKLRRRGIDVMRGRPANLMEIITVGQAMRKVPEGVPTDLSIGELTGRFVGEGREALPVVDADGSYRGVITAQEVEGSMRENALDATAGSLAHHLPTLKPDETLEGALSMLVRQEVSGLPVVTRAGNQVIGWLTHRDVLSAYASRLGQEVATAEGAPAVASRPEGAPRGRSRPEVRSRLRDYRIVDLEIGPGSEPAGRRISELPWPAFSLPIAVRRNGRSFRPGPPTVIEAGDRLTVLVPYDLVEHIGELLAAPAEPQAAEPQAAEPQAAEPQAAEPPPAEPLPAEPPPVAPAGPPAGAPDSPRAGEVPPPTEADQPADAGAPNPPGNAARGVQGADAKDG
jgi:CIC family chloride channel protein